MVKTITIIFYVIIFLMVSYFFYWYIAVYDRNREFVQAAGDRDIVKLERLLTTGKFNIDERALDDWTALTLATSKGYTDVVEFLILNGADVNAVSGGGKTALFWAKYNNHNELVTLLKKHGAM